MSAHWLKPCGTEAAYRRHRRHGDRACLSCLFAHAQYEKWRAWDRRRAA